MDNSELVFLRKLAAVCRKAGIKSFTGHGVQFELGDDTPTAIKAKAAKPQKKTVTLNTPEGPIETDSPTEMELLLWSVQEQPGSDA